MTLWGLTLHPDALDPTLLGPALAAGLLVLLTHVPLGAQVLRKGIVFIDLAIAQIAGLGVMLVTLLGGQPGGWPVQAAAGAAALLGALALTWTERRWPEVQEALIGCLFVVASCAGLLLVAGHPHGGEHLQDLLVGQILWVTPEQLGVTAALSVAVLALWFWAGRQGGVAFYVAFALAVTASVQLVGVYLVFASLIMPALAVRALTVRRPGLWAYALGAGSFAAGLGLSALLDLPSGPAVVLVMAVVSVGVAALSRRHPPT